MVGEQQYQEVVVSEQGVEVTKRLQIEEYELPSIEFAIESERSDIAVVRLIDPVPDEVNVADIGFHPEHGKEYWRVENNAVIFERELSPGEGCYTLYGIGSENPQLESFILEPADLEVDQREDSNGEPAALGEDIPDLENDEEVSETMENTKGASTPIKLSLEGEDAALSGDQVPGSQQLGTNGDTMEQQTTSVVDALVAELDERDRTDETLETLREALSLRNGSMDARMTRLQSEVDELQAYTGALEEFLDENGTGMDLIEEFQDHLDTIESDVSELNATVSDHDDQFNSVDASREELEATSDEAHERLADVTNTLERLEDQVTEVESRVPESGVPEDVDELRTEIQQLHAWQEQVVQAFGSSVEPNTDDE